MVASRHIALWGMVWFLAVNALVAQQALPKLMLLPSADGVFTFQHNLTGTVLYATSTDEAYLIGNNAGKVFHAGQWHLVTLQKGVHPTPGYEEIRNFKQERAAFRRGGRWGYLAPDGVEIIPAIFEKVFDFREQGAVVYDGLEWYVIDAAGKRIYSSHPDLSYIQETLRHAALFRMGGQEKAKSTGLSEPVDGVWPDQPHTANSTPGGCPDNISFENGNFNGWAAFTGTTSCISGVNRTAFTATAPTYFRHTLLTSNNNNLLDPYGFFPVNPPDGSSRYVLLGNDVNGAQAEKIRYLIQVPVDQPNFSITYNYAVVFQDPEHARCEQPRFSAKLFDPVTNTYLPCGTYEYISDDNIPGFYNSPLDEMIKIKPWSEAFINLSAYAGKTLYLEFSNSDCTKGGHWGYSYLDVHNICNLTADIDYQCFAPNKTTLKGPSGFKAYKWWKADFSAIVSNSREAVLNPGLPVGSKLWVEVFPYNGLGCRDTLAVQVVPLYPDAAMQLPSPQCWPASNMLFTSTSTFRKSRIAEYYWSMGDQSNKVGKAVTHSYASPGTYHVQLIVVDENGCRDTADGNINIFKAPSAAILSNKATTFCAGDSISLYSVSTPGSGPITQYQWLSNGLPIPGAALTNVSVYHSGNFQLQVTDQNQCTDTSLAVAVVAHPLPIGSVQPAAHPVLCSGGHTQLTVQSDAATFRWYRNGVLVPSAQSASIDVVDEGTYTAEMTSTHGCITMADGAAFITLRTQPVPDFRFAAFCRGVPIPFTNRSDTSRSGAVQWEWDFGDGYTSILEHPVHVYERGTTYTVKLKATPVSCPGLSVTASHKVEVEEPLPGKRYDPVNVVANVPAVLQARGFGKEYLWFPSIGLRDARLAKPVFAHDQPVEYTIRIKTEAGCITYDTLLVRMFKQSDILVPTAFSPNGDGHNDRLDVFLVSIREFRYFRVFNRWGQCLFETRSADQRWDGTFHGVRQPLETYVWVAEGISNEGETVIRRGQTILIR